jgi:uncharacterized protein
MTLLRSFVAAAVVALAAAPVQPALAGDSDGPSFDCGRARTFVEHAICASPSLSEKDMRMARAYRSFLDQYTEGGGPGTDTASIRNEQRAWLARRNRCRTNACLHRLYDQRINDLEVDY